jgi:hypothetical protein
MYKKDRRALSHGSPVGRPLAEARAWSNRRAADLEQSDASCSPTCRRARSGTEHALVPPPQRRLRHVEPLAPKARDAAQADQRGRGKLCFERANEAPASQPRARAIARHAARAGDVAGASPLCAWTVEARYCASIAASAAATTTAAATAAAHGRVHHAAEAGAQDDGARRKTRATVARRRRIAFGRAREAHARAPPRRATTSFPSTLPSIFYILHAREDSVFARVATLRRPSITTLNINHIITDQSRGDSVPAQARTMRHVLRAGVSHHLRGARPLRPVLPVCRRSSLFRLFRRRLSRSSCV